MDHIRIADSKRGFELEGNPLFYLADTAWSSFTNTSLADWDYYLHYREQQGFTHVQLNTTPQWDRQLPDLNCYPYASPDGLTMDFSTPVESFWERARLMCGLAQKHGIRPALVLLWANLVPGTWIDRIGKSAQKMPFEAIDRHVELVVRYLDEFDPIYVISGDTDFDGGNETVRYYAEAARSIESRSPDAIKTFHLAGLVDRIPSELANVADFFMFQSGHVAREDQKMIFKLPAAFLKQYSKRPIVNAEPCYEQMGLRRSYGRYTRPDVRFAAWTSVLSGACAGIAYGAHGIWNWKTSQSVGARPGNIFDEPFEWQDALHFPGAWDYAFIPRFLKAIGAHELTPANDVLALETDAVRLARTERGGYLAYLPWSSRLVIDVDLTGWTAQAIDLEGRMTAGIPLSVSNGRTTIGQHAFLNDALVRIEKTPIAMS